MFVQTAREGDVLDKENVPPGAASDHIGQQTVLAADVNNEKPGHNSSNETKYSCDAIRDKINAYRADTKTDASDFQKQLQVQTRSYKSFIHQDGPHVGVRNPTYKAAHDFFVARKLEGKKTASPAAKSAAATSTTSKAKSQTKSADKAEGKKNDDKAGVPSFDALPRLDGEETDSVPVWDTCNDICSKIKAHLVKNSVSSAAVYREISKCLLSGSVAASGSKGFLDKNKMPTSATRVTLFTRVTCTLRNCVCVKERRRVRKGRRRKLLGLRREASRESAT